MRLSTLSALACSTSMPISMCAPSVTAMALTALEGRLLELCAPVFAPRIQIPEPAAVAAIYAQISAIETTLGEPLGVEATAAAVQGDWRLVFSDSASICKEGILGYGAIPFVSSLAVLQRLSSGSVPAQTIEALELPLGAKNAVALKGEWRIDEDDEGCILVCEYAKTEYGGATLPNPPQVQTGPQVVAAASVHAGERVRVERNAAGATTVWARQDVSIEAQLDELLK